MTLPAYSLDAVLLTQQNCSLCDQSKVLLDRLATDYPLAVTVLDFASPEGRALAERYGLPFSPALILAGEAFGYGHISERGLRREIERRLGADRGESVGSMSGQSRRIRSVLGWLVRSW
jgi:hypothetical protein